MHRKEEQSEEEFLASYSAGDYERPSVTVDMVVFGLGERPAVSYRRLPTKSLRVLLVKRGGHPCRGAWALPGGFVNIDEDLDVAARRELLEETSLGDVRMEQLYTWGDVGRDPRTRIISTSYLALVPEDRMATVAAGDDAADAKWFRIHRSIRSEDFHVAEDGGAYRERVRELTLTSDDGDIACGTVITRNGAGRPATGSDSAVLGQSGEGGQALAFDHAKIINHALERIEDCVERTDLAFGLMPERFTLSELQAVYEVVLGRRLEKANFRRKVQGMVVATDEYTSEGAHRPARLYRHNKQWAADF